MPSWIPVPGTTSGQLVEAALELFGADGYDSVAVTAIARRAGVTTGALYHHFGSKAGLYRLVRTDVERRVVDRFEAAAAVRPVAGLADLAPVIMTGFDYLVRDGYTRLLAEGQPSQADGEPAPPDLVEAAVDRLLSPPDRLGYLVVAAWRAALWQAGTGPEQAAEARRGLVTLLGGRKP